MKPRSRTRLAAVVLASLCVSRPYSAPAQPQEPAAQTTLRSDSLEVLVDVVVRDKKGRLLHGLKAGDVVVMEDGLPQTITSFREVNLATPPAAPPPHAPASETRTTVTREPVQMSKQIRLVSLVYDRLGPDGRRLGRQASLDFLHSDLGPNVYYGVFSIDRGFRVIQPYTNDLVRLRTAIERATSGEKSNFAAVNFGQEVNAFSALGSPGAAEAVAAASAGGRGPGPVEGTALSTEVAVRMVKEMADMSEMLVREDLGRMSVFSLWGIIKELQKLPGRKTAIYFAEGLQMPNGLVEQFKAMVSDANKGNVAVYAVDARGLTTTSDMAPANQKLNEAAQWSRYVRTTEHESFEANKQEFRTFDRALDSIRANQQNMMHELAESTGGFLIANTNDLRPQMRRLSEEFNTYYEIAYRPQNQLADGRFRAIEVKVNHPDAMVQARDGYFALPALDGQTVFPYEVPLLKALSRTELPKELEFHSRVLQFHQQAGLEHGVLVFDLPMKGVSFSRDEAAGKYRTHITVLALLKDESGRVVAKLSRDVPLNEPLDKLGGFRQGRFIATRLVRLPPGRYLLESAAADYEGNRVGARRAVVVVTPHPARPGISELCLIRRVDKLPDPRDLLDPFQLASGRVIPTLIDSVAGGKGRMLSVFFSMYPDDSGAEKPKLLLDFMKDGRLLARTSPGLPGAEVSGAVPFIANMPLDNVERGQYQLRATLIQGEQASQKSIYVNVE
jgi:VWFA-related protein